MASKIFIDANVLLDFCLKREQYAEVRQIVELAVTGRIHAVITPAIVRITGYWLTKAYGQQRAKDILLNLLADIAVIDISHETTLTALHSSITDVEDALQYYTAIHHHVDVFVSIDKNLKKSSIPTLPVYTPKEFLKNF